MNLHDVMTGQGAVLAPDGIPLHFGDLKTEYRAALEAAVLLNRSHEGRIEAAGRDRLSLMHRISTNDLESLVEGAGAATVFTTPSARIVDRATVYHRGERALVITEPGRGQALYGYLQRNIFFTDDLRLKDIAAETHQFALHGPRADAVMDALAPGATQLAPMRSLVTRIGGVETLVARNKLLSGAHWTIVAPAGEAARVWNAVLDAGRAHGLVPAGSLTYNTLRIRAGRPAAGRELSEEYIPLEVGLWDEISFHKGCYTGQEIIARMESRSRVARVMVRLEMTAFAEAPAELRQDGHAAGTLTSSVAAPDGSCFGIGVVKTAVAQPGAQLQVGAVGTTATITDFAGTPLPMVG